MNYEFSNAREYLIYIFSMLFERDEIEIMKKPDSCNDSSVDVAIITILDEEYKAVLDHLENHKRYSGIPEFPNLLAWELGELKCDSAEGSYSVVLALTRGAGTQNGALATYTTIERWKPRYVFLVGIAGGFHRDGLDKGDVVLSDVIYGYEYGKLKEQFEPRHDWTYRCDTSLIMGLRAFALSTNWAEKIKGIRPDSFKIAPKSFCGSIASGDKVVDSLDQEFFATILKSWSRLLAVEMEGAGAAEAIELAKSNGYDVHFLMVRGISDMPQTGLETTVVSQTSERDEWKKYAAEVAAVFTISYIKNGLPKPPLSQTAHPQQAAGHVRAVCNQSKSSRFICL